MLIDVQTGAVADAHQCDAVAATISTVADKAREEGVPIVWVQHSDEQLEKGSEAWEYVPELTRQESEPLVHKTFGARPHGWGHGDDNTTSPGQKWKTGILMRRQD